MRTSARPGAAAPTLLRLVVIASFFLCFIGSPWDESATVGAIVTVLSAVPLAALAVLVSLARRAAVEESVRVGEESGHAAQLPQVAARVRGALMEAHAAAAALASGGPPAPVPSMTHIVGGRHDGLVVQTLDYVQERYAAGEDLRVDDLREFMHEHALNRLQRLQHFHEGAFAVGLAGTVFGVGVQVYVAQEMTRNGILSQGFLIGILVKAVATLVGLLVAAYARWLRHKLLGAYDQVCLHLEHAVVYHLAPLFRQSAAERGDFAEVLHQAANDFGGAMRRLGHSLETSLKDAVQRSGEVLKGFAAGELAQTVKANIAEPFREEMRHVHSAVVGVAATVTESANVLRASADRLRNEMTGALTASGSVHDRLKETCNMVHGVTLSFEQVARSVRDAAEILKKYQQELDYSIHQLRSQDGNPRRWSEIEAEQMRQLEALGAVQQDAARVLAQAVRVLESAPGSGGQEGMQ